MRTTDEEWRERNSVDVGQPGMLERRIIQDMCDRVERDKRLHGPNLNEPSIDIAGVHHLHLTGQTFPAARPRPFTMCWTHSHRSIQLSLGLRDALVGIV